jgi:hypothetical protein
MVEEGYFFPVLPSHFPVYVYSFINEIQAVQNPTGTSIPLGKGIKAKLYESKHLYMMQDVDLYKTSVLPRLFKSALQGCPRIWADKSLETYERSKQSRKESSPIILQVNIMERFLVDWVKRAHAHQK